MATIKSYTDIKQSRKLAEILPLESADMFHFIHSNNSETVGIGYEKASAEFYSKTQLEYLPCWSLAALLDILPEHILRKDKIHNEMAYIPSYRWELTPSSIYYTDGNNIMDNIVARYDKKKNTIIDACYDMILKLHELNLL